ncbi:MAG: hypothetical protein K8R21_15605, partial [Leptospira sp.]|nr:hypothetical protein [Leptospira sp.]
MKNSIIWHISDGKDFPIELWKHPKLILKVNKVQFKDLNSINVSGDDINIFFLEISGSDWKQQKSAFIKRYETKPEIAIVLIASPDSESIYPDVPNNPKIEILENPLHKRELRLIIDRVIQTEFFKTAALEMGESCLQNVGFFEGLFELAHREIKDADKTKNALNGILEYEHQIKKSQNSINQAIDKVNSLKESELLGLHSRIKANENLDRLREQELKDAIRTKEATEK